MYSNTEATYLLTFVRGRVYKYHDDVMLKRLTTAGLLPCKVFLLFCPLPANSCVCMSVFIHVAVKS